MGSTESRRSSSIDHEYRLVRRFVSDFYCSEITIIEHKRSKEQFALRQIVHQTCPQALSAELDTRQAHNHQNVVRLKKYQIQTDFGMCSNMSKLQVLFEYHQQTLEDLMEERSQPWTDTDALDMIRQLFSGLAFMERRGVFSLLAGPRSIMVTEKERSSDDLNVQEKRYTRKEFSQWQRYSLADLSRRPNRINSSTQSLSSLRCYKMFQPFESISCSKNTFDLQSRIQVPLHTQIVAKFSQHFLPDELIKLQNTHTVIMLGAALCMGCDVYDLDININGRLSIDRLRSTVQRLKSSHPRFSTDALRILMRDGRESGSRLERFRIRACPKWDCNTERWQQEEKGRERNLMTKAISRKRLSLLQVN